VQACLRGWAHGNRRTVVLRRCGDKLFCAGRTRSYEPLTLPAVTRCQLGCLFHSPGNPWNFFSFSRLVPAVGFQQGTSMPLYRAYLIHKGQVWTAVDLNCTDDADARQQAESLLNGHDVELWQRDRRIALLISKDSPVASPSAAPDNTTRFFFGLQGARNIHDALGFAFETDLAAFRAAQELAAELSSTRPNLRGNTCVVVTRNDCGDIYYVSV